MRNQNPAIEKRHKPGLYSHISLISMISLQVKVGLLDLRVDVKVRLGGKL